MTKEALNLALDALETSMYPQQKQLQAITAIKEALAQPEQEPKCGAIIEVFGKDWRLEYLSLPVGKHKLYTQQYTYTTPEQEPVAWKLVPRDATDEMLKAMDECSTEGYDERLYTGHAASVYMAAVDAAPVPPQRTWVGLTEDEILLISADCASSHQHTDIHFARAIEAKLRSKNESKN